MVASQNIAGAPADWMELPPESAALLVEFGADTDAELDELVAGAEGVLAARSPIRPPDFTRDPERIEVAWTVREGLHGLIGRLRPPGTALIIEDVCVPPARIAESARDIQALLGERGFLTGVAGHTSAGNLHFMLTPDFSKPEDTDRYESFMESLVELVVDKYDGSLKAEHGTGINMAPYVEREWGPKATELMWRVKELADPDGVLAPGVLVSRDQGAHLRNLKTTPPIEDVVTNCVECGFCEPVCPSRHLTLTPRQRIVVRREMARQAPGSPVQRTLLEQYEYEGIETCAADGSCGPACPLAIDTGRLVKDLRARQHGEKAERRAEDLARRWARVERLARAGLRTGPLGRAGARVARTFLSEELVPDLPQEMPHAASGSLPTTERDGAVAVYMPACVNRIFGRPRHPHQEPYPSLPEAMVELSLRAGRPVWIPDDAPGNCCGVPWSSKGLQRGHELMANRTVEALWRWSGEGELPIVTDASSCSLGLRDEVAPALGEENIERHAKLEILDSVEWAHDRLLPELSVSTRVGGTVALHPTCSTRHLGVAAKLEALGRAIADEVFVPIRATCCGMAGDRGLLHPELTRSATADQDAEFVGAGPITGRFCSNRTCEIGLQQGMGVTYASIVQGLEWATRPPSAS
jgi:D-lactate dehydrogenase